MSRRNRSALRTSDYAAIFAALGDETRLTIVQALSDGEPRSIAQLTEGSELTRQAITKHLRVLEGARLVRSTRQGRESLFQLDPVPIRLVKDYADVVSSQWDNALARLKLFVEK